MAGGPAGGVPAAAVAAAAAGTLLVWSGLKGASLSDSLRSLISGSPPSGKNVNPVGTPQATAAEGADPAGTALLQSGASGLVGLASQYQGHLYHFGGYESDPLGWDCSSYMNWVIGHDAVMPIPGYKSGAYPGTVHGPPTGLWLVWPGAKTIPRASLQPGDLLVWQTHMGMYVGGGNMISALGPNGTPSTKVTTIARGSPGAEILVCRRLVAAGGT